MTGKSNSENRLKIPGQVLNILTNSSNSFNSFNSLVIKPWKITIYHRETIYFYAPSIPGCLPFVTPIPHGLVPAALALAEASVCRPWNPRSPCGAWARAARAPRDACPRAAAGISRRWGWRSGGAAWENAVLYIYIYYNIMCIYIELCIWLNIYI